ncbi:MAG: hypothetical protein IKR57_03230 [Bacilli bacterium]|nr:hypothetical protein [Bacilli bacterium]
MKKVFKIFLILLLFMTFIRVNASTISIDEFINGFKNTDLYKLFTQEDDQGNGNTIDVIKDETNHKINISVNNVAVVAFDYTDNYISYSDPDTVITEELVSEPIQIFSSVMIINIMYTVLDLTNHLDKDLDIPDEFNTDEIFEEFGFNYLSENYSFTNGDTTSSGNYIRNFKMSLDTDKINHLVDTYGVSRDESVTVPDGLKPTIIISDIEDKSVHISFDLQTNDNVEYYCQAYRSTSENGEYVLAAGGIMTACKQGDGSFSVSFEDDNLSPNTTYYYKAKIVGGDTFSDIVSIKTKASKVNTEVNPKTGDVSPVIYVSVLLVISVVCLIIVSRNIRSGVL